MSEPVSELTWITKNGDLPDICISCGQYTDQRVKSNYSGEQAVIQRTSGDINAIGCLVRVLLLPFGILGHVLASAFTHDQEVVNEKRKLIRFSGTITVPQCHICNSTEPPKPKQSDATVTYFAFATHENFRREYLKLNPSD